MSTERMDTEHAFAALRPSGIDELTAEALPRRREADLSAALRSPVCGIERRSRRRPALLLAATAGIAATALVGALTVSASQETWTPVDPHDPARTVMNIDPKVSFDDPADEDRWRALGSPDLLPSVTGVPGTAEGKVNDYPGLTDAQIAGLSPLDRSGW